MLVDVSYASLYLRTSPVQANIQMTIKVLQGHYELIGKVRLDLLSSLLDDNNCESVLDNYRETLIHTDSKFLNSHTASPSLSRLSLPPALQTSCDIDNAILTL